MNPDRSSRSRSVAGRSVKRKTRRRKENSRNYLHQLLLRESDCKHHSIELNRKHTFVGFQATKLYELPGIEAVDKLAVSDKLLFVLGRQGSIVAIDREYPEKVYRLKQQYSNHITGQIFFDEKTECLLQFMEWWCEPDEEEDDEEQHHVPIVAAGYYRISLASIIGENPVMGTIVMYEEENDSKNWQFDLSNRLIVAEWNNPENSQGSHLLSHYLISNLYKFGFV